jgi:vancomycin permeability regulator SanA
MKNYAYKIDPSLTIEGDVYGLSTYDSLWRLKNIYGARKVIVVTQKFHLSRAIYIARGLGLEASGIASDNDDYGPSMFWYQIRETVARCKDFFQVIIKPKAQYY